MENYCDLHIHTTYSDGWLSPNEVLLRSVQNGVDVIAITDHNTIKGAIEAKALSKQYEIEVIIGIELTAFDQEEIHILGYFENVDLHVIEAFLEKGKRNYVKCIMKLVKAMMKKGIAIGIEDLKVDGSYSIKRVQEILIEHELITTDEDYIYFLLKDKADQYYKLRNPNCAECVQVIKDAGGVAVLAHPSAYSSFNFKLVDNIQKLICNGLVGIECYHPKNSIQQTEEYIRLSKELSLIQTGGSDFHGDEHHPADIGDLKIDIDVSEALKYVL